MSEIIRERELVLLPAEHPLARVSRIYGKGTDDDPAYAVIEIPAQTRTIRVERLVPAVSADG